MLPYSDLAENSPISAIVRRFTPEFEIHIKKLPIVNASIVPGRSVFGKIS